MPVQPFRPVFLATAGTPPVEWRRWIDMFEDYILDVGFPVSPTGSAEAVITATAQRKAALFRSSLGTEGYRVYCSLTDNAREPYADAVARLRGHFDQPASIIFSRAQFSRRQQHPGESVTQYVASLREMASRCGFPGDQLGDRVRDQFVAWCACDKIRERLLQEPGDRTLDDMVQLALTMERARAEASSVSSAA